MSVPDFTEADRERLLANTSAGVTVANIDDGYQGLLVI